jgi:uncharacterized integral membrane protein
MPEKDIPSFHKYVHEHSVGDIVGRFGGGFGVILSTVMRSYGYAWFVILYLVALLSLTVQNSDLRRFLVLFWRTNPSLVLFVAAYFMGYLALYAWYTRIVAGNRIVLAQFLLRSGSQPDHSCVWEKSYGVSHQPHYPAHPRFVSVLHFSSSNFDEVRGRMRGRANRSELPFRPQP